MIMFSISTESRNMQVEVEATKTMAMVTGTYVMCWIPSTVYFLFIIFQENILGNEIVFCSNGAFYLQFAISIYINALLDPFIYGYRSKDVRDKFKRSKLNCLRAKQLTNSVSSNDGHVLKEENVMSM